MWCLSAYFLFVLYIIPFDKKKKNEPSCGVAFAFMITQTVPAYLSAPLGLMSEKDKQLPLLS